MAKKRSGDGYPLDRIGQMLFDGCIVATAEPIPFDNDHHPRLVLGFIKKLGRSYADVVIDGITLRFRQPNEQLILIDPSLLSSQSKEFEKLLANYLEP